MTEIGELISLLFPPLGGTPDEDPGKQVSKKKKCAYRRKTHKSDFSGADTKFCTSTQIGASNVAFTLRIQLARNRVTVVSRFRWGSVANDITKKEKKRTIYTFKRKVRKWSYKFKLKVIDPECGTRTMPIRFQLLWNPRDTSVAATHRVNMVRNMNRAAVTGFVVDIGYNDVTNDHGWVLAHEYGHTVALPDEYFYTAGGPASVVYKKADGSTDSFALEPAGRNIMRSHASNKYLKRHFYFVAIEAQELLRQKTGRNVTCEIV